MTDSPNRPPLWWAMQGAYFEGRNPGFNDAHGYAAEIRALRDWLVPEEPPPHRGMRPGGSNLTYQETLSVERQRLRDLLTTEADRAERGDVEHG